eukprot:1105378-Rhodomonas_salina.3
MSIQSSAAPEIDIVALPAVTELERVADGVVVKPRMPGTRSQPASLAKTACGFELTSYEDEFVGRDDKFVASATARDAEYVSIVLSSSSAVLLKPSKSTMNRRKLYSPLTATAPESSTNDDWLARDASIPWASG